MSDDIQEERKSAPTLTHSQAVKRMEEIHARMEEIGEQDEIVAEDRSEFDGLADEFRQLEQHVERLEVAAELAKVRSTAPQKGRRIRVEAGSSQGSRSDYDRDAVRAIPGLLATVGIEIVADDRRRMGNRREEAIR